MTMFRKGRYLYWLLAKFVQKYKRALTLGCIVGIVLSVVAYKTSPFFLQLWFSPVERIGVVGEFTPSTLPDSVIVHLSMGLTTIHEDGSALAGLSESWIATDSGKRYVFRLREDMKWHTGEPVTAKDVNYNIRGVVFTPINDATLEVTLPESFSPFPTLVSKPILQRGLVGFGTHKVASIRLKGDTVQYLKLIPVISNSAASKEYRFYRTENQAIAAYKQGEIDTLSDISSRESIANLTKATITEHVSSDRMVALYFNTKEDIMNEKAVRQALGYSLPEFDQTRAYSPLRMTSWAYADKVLRKYDPNETLRKKLITSAGLASASAELTITTFDQYEPVGQLIANAWTEAGIPTKIKIENSLPTTYQVLLSAQNIPPDPDQYPLWHSTQQQTNITHYSNVKIDKLLEDARRETDQEKRKKLYADFQRFLTEDAPALFLYYPTTYTIRRH